MQQLNIWTEKDLALLDALQKACNNANLNIFPRISDETIWWLRISPRIVLRDPKNRVVATIPLLGFIFCTILFFLGAYMVSILALIMILPMYICWRNIKTDKTHFANIYILCPNFLYAFAQEVDAKDNPTTTKFAFGIRIDQLSGVKSSEYDIAFYTNSLTPTTLYIPTPHCSELKRQIVALRPDDIIDANK
jgi:hypothetical protein